MNKYEQALSNIKMKYREMKEEQKAQFNLLQELVEKSTPKKAAFKDYGPDIGRERRCPCCNKILFDWDKFCSRCGQALK